MKKVFSLLFVMIVMISSIKVCYAESINSETDLTIVKINFIDVKENDYFNDAVQWAVNEEITSGTSYNTFSPNEICTQAQILTFLWRANGSPLRCDCYSEGKYYEGAISWAKTRGLIDNSINPDAPCTRIDVIKYLYRLETNHDIDMSYAENMKDVTSRQKGMVAWAIGKDITKGTSDTTFSPDDNCTRGQIVTFLYRSYANK